MRSTVRQTNLPHDLERDDVFGALRPKLLRLRDRHAASKVDDKGAQETPSGEITLISKTRQKQHPTEALKRIQQNTL